LKYDKFINLQNVKKIVQMKNSTLTPEQSLLLITRTIEETKERFKENGHILVFWGILMLIIIGSQFVLSILELYKYTLYPNYLYPLGGIYMIYIWVKEKKQNKPITFIGNIIGNMGWVVGLNLMIMGFFFSGQLGAALPPVFLILFAVFIFICGLTIRFKPLIISGLFVNLIGLGSFFLEANYHGYSMMLGAVAGLIIPGILLNIARRKENV
jgi:hypothetical protein